MNNEKGFKNRKLFFFFCVKVVDDYKYKPILFIARHLFYFKISYGCIRLKSQQFALYSLTLYGKRIDIYVYMHTFLILSSYLQFLSPVFNNLKQNTLNLNPSKSLLIRLKSTLYMKRCTQKKKIVFHSYFRIAKKFNNFIKTHINGGHVHTYIRI